MNSFCTAGSSEGDKWMHPNALMLIGQGLFFCDVFLDTTLQTPLEHRLDLILHENPINLAGCLIVAVT